MQAMLHADYPEGEISILGIDGFGSVVNQAVFSDIDLPWLQDIGEESLWNGWEVTYRDVIIYNQDGIRAGVFNLTEHNLQDPDEFVALTELLLSIAGVN